MIMKGTIFINGEMLGESEIKFVHIPSANEIEPIGAINRSDDESVECGFTLQLSEEGNELLKEIIIPENPFYGVLESEIIE